ncbi:MAG: hypothetical protein Q9159_006771, partial [Coniocarpon cinnabarinum]
TTLTIPPNTSVATVKSLVALQVPSAIPSAESRLIFNGRNLDNAEKLLSDYHVPPTSTLELALPSTAEPTSQETSSAEPAQASASIYASAEVTGQAKPSPAKPKTTTGGLKKKGPRCDCAGCTSPAQRIVGDCGFCGGHFCGKHRLLESHSCDGLDNARKEDKDRNSKKLEGERTVSGRVLV